MKTYINGQGKHADSDMASKYQLSKVYTKVQSHIETVSTNLTNNIETTNNNLNTLSEEFKLTSENLNTKDNELNIFIGQVSSKLDDSIQNINQDINNTKLQLINDINITSSALKTNIQQASNILTTNIAQTSSILNTIIDQTSSVLNTNIENTNTKIDNIKLQLISNINTEKENIINTLTDNDNLVSGNLKRYIDNSIENLGSVYRLIGKLDNGTVATSIEQLPSEAVKGDIYFIEKTLSDGTIETQQYICISDEEAVLAENKWQKFGTSVDLSNYYTISETNSQDALTLEQAKIYSNNNLETAMADSKNKADTAESNSKSYTDIKINQLSSVVNALQSKHDTEITNLSTLIDTVDKKVDTEKENILNILNENVESLTEAIETVNTDSINYSDLISASLSTTVDLNLNVLSSTLSTAVNYDLNILSSVLSTSLTNNILAGSKQYTNLSIADLINIYIPKRKLIESNDIQPEFGILSGNSTYKFYQPVEALTFNIAEDSDLQTLLYFTTAASFTPGIPDTINYIQTDNDINNLEFNTKYVMTIRNLIAKIQKIK